MISFPAYTKLISNNTDCLAADKIIGLLGDQACTIPIIRFFNESQKSIEDEYFGHEAFEAFFLDGIEMVKISILITKIII